MTIKFKVIEKVDDESDVGEVEETPSPGHGKGVAAKPPATEVPAQQVLGPDPLADAVNVIESLTDAEAALSKMHELMLDQAMNWFQIGGTLSQIKEKGWFGDYASFGELCSNEFGFKKSKAYHLIAIYKTLLEAGLSWKEVKGLGWPKLRLICAKAVSANFDQEQFSKILEKAKMVNYVELEASLKPELSSAGETHAKMLAFKPHPEQLETIKAALDKAKEQSGTEHDTVAIEYICLDYLSSGASKPKAKAEPLPAGSDVAIPTPDEDGYAWPSVEAMYRHVLEEHDGHRDKTLTALFDALGEVFPDVDVTVNNPEAGDAM